MVVSFDEVLMTGVGLHVLRIGIIDDGFWFVAYVRFGNYVSVHASSVRLTSGVRLSCRGFVPFRQNS